MLFLRKFSVKNKITFLVEKSTWSIMDDGINIQKNISNHNPNINFSIKTNLFCLNCDLLHFGSQFMWTALKDAIPVNMPVVVTYFHGKFEDGIEMSAHIKSFLESSDRISLVITSSIIVENRLTKYGLSPDKIRRIPIGIDLNKFNSVANLNNNKIRNNTHIPKQSFIIGSFQKDGEGWQEGFNPKLIKGPDILVDVLKIINKKYNILVLLTGPSRGYVKNKLSQLGIPYVHKYIEQPEELPKFYKLLDCYLITSRDEGGPKGLLESLACGVPVVATSVGMCPELIINGVNGYLALTEDPIEIANKLEMLIKYPKQCHTSLEEYSWNSIAKLHLDEYLKILDNEKVK
jgi:glycosyltransferase involved in cell wall biosynthesis